jgi:bacterioferritin
MKDNGKLLTVLNQILVDKLTTTNQNIFHSKANDSLEFTELYKEVEKETAEEFKQAEWLIKRIIFLEIWRSHQSQLNISQKDIENCYSNMKNVG